jgi:hypothetical protein
MFRKSMSFALSVWLFNFGILPAFAASRGDEAPAHITKMKAEIAKRGLGEKASVRVMLRDKKELKGYISEAGEDRFVITETLSGETIPVAYSDVTQVKSLGHPFASNLFVWLGVGVIATATVATFAFSGAGF